MFSKLSKVFIYIVISVFSLLCLLPFIMVVMGSLSSESDIVNYGYRLIPKHISTISYRVLFTDAGTILDAYGVSMAVTVFGTLASLLVNTMMAYAVSRKVLKYRNALSVYTLITMLFNGGMVPWYIVCINYLHLKDKLIAMIIPYLANAWYIFLLRNYIRMIPEEMYESAKIDGAGEYTIFFKIMLRLSTPALATVALFTALGYWNDWWLGLMLIDRKELQPLQLMLRTIVSNVMFLKNANNAAEISRITNSIPSEGIKMAVCVVTVGPIVFLYPFLQRYFVKGIMVGAVKG